MKYKHDLIPDAGQLYPDGMLRVKVLRLEETEARNGQASVKVSTRIGDPKKFRNQPYNFTFVLGVTKETAAKLGIEEDLEGTSEATIQANPTWRRYKSFLKAAGVPFSGDTEEDAAFIAAKRPVIVVENGHHEDANGRKYNDANAFYAEDSAPVSFDAAPRPSAVLTPRAAAPAAAPAAAASDEGWDS